jgi:hypothetical protein
LRTRQAIAYATLWTLIGSHVAFIAAAPTHDVPYFSPSHVIVTVALALALAVVIAGALEVDVLVRLSAVDGVAWVLMIPSIVDSAISGAPAVILAGVALSGLGDP